MPRYKLTPTEAIQLIRSAGSPGSGTPGIESFPGPTRGTEGSRTCRPEAYHPAHNQEKTAYYVRLAGANGLIATGGSDYHGPGHLTGCRLGSNTVPYSIVADLKKNAIV